MRQEWRRRQEYKGKISPVPHFIRAQGQSVDFLEQYIWGNGVNHVLLPLGWSEGLGKEGLKKIFS